MKHQVFIERCRDSKPETAILLAKAIAKRYGVAPQQILSRLKEGSFRVKANLDFADARSFMTYLEKEGALCRIVNDKGDTVAQSSELIVTVRGKPAKGDATMADSAAKDADTADEAGFLTMEPHVVGTELPLHTPPPPPDEDLDDDGGGFELGLAGSTPPSLAGKLARPKIDSGLGKSGLGKSGKSGADPFAPPKADQAKSSADPFAPPKADADKFAPPKADQAKVKADKFAPPKSGADAFAPPKADLAKKDADSFAPPKAEDDGAGLSGGSMRLETLDGSSEEEQDAEKGSSRAETSDVAAFLPPDMLEEKSLELEVDPEDGPALVSATAKSSNESSDSVERLRSSAEMEAEDLPELQKEVEIRPPKDGVHRKAMYFLSANERLRFVVGVLLAVFIGYGVVNLLASSREASTYASVIEELQAQYAAANTSVAWDALDDARATALETLKVRRRGIVILCIFVWLLVSGLLGFLWVRAIDWERWEEVISDRDPRTTAPS